MRLFFGLILGFALLFGFLFSYKKNKDLFSPICFFAVYQFIRYVPKIISGEGDSFISLNEETIIPTFFLELLFVIGVYFGYCAVKGKNKHFEPGKPGSAIRVPLVAIIFIYSIGLFSRLLLINAAGGLSYVLKNMGNAYWSYAHNSSGYLIALGNLMTFANLLMIHKISLSKKKILLVLILVLMIVVGMLSYLVFSSRSPALEILLIAIFGYHCLIKRITLKGLFDFRFLLLLLSVVVIITFMPILRTQSSGASTLDYSNYDFFSTIGSGVANIFDEFSAVNVDTFVYNHFNSSNYWHGTNFLNLFVAPIPSSIYPNKPCIDDGNYLCNIMYGYNVLPNVGRDDLTIKYSMPFNTPSCMYANFGIIGVIIAGLLLGVIYKKAYNLLNNKRNPFTVLLYLLIIYQLEFSTLSISQTVVPIVVCGAVYYLCITTCGKKAPLTEFGTIVRC